MGCDISLYRETHTHHPSNSSITYIEREEVWYNQSREIIFLLVSKYEKGLTDVLCVEADETAEYAQEILNFHADRLDKCDIEALEELIAVCEKEESYTYSYHKMMIGY
jgi:hypothetical protein